MPLMMSGNGAAKPLPSTDSTCDTVEVPRASPASAAFPQHEAVGICGLNDNAEAKKRPKRRRKPQKPGFTAKVRRIRRNVKKREIGGGGIIPLEFGMLCIRRSMIHYFSLPLQSSS